MSIEQQLEKIEEMAKALIAKDAGAFLVEVKIKPTNNVKVFIDADEGANIDKLVHYNRALYKQLEESGLFPNGDFSLEVSSPGLDEPLKLHRQYLKNIGRNVEVTLKDGMKREGKLLSAAGDSIVIEEEKGKKTHPKQPARNKEVVHHTISIHDIKTTKIQIKF